MSQEEKDKIKEYQRKKYQELIQHKKEVLQKKKSFLSIKRMSKKTLKFVNIRVNKKEFHKSNQPIDLMSVNTEYIVTSDKFRYSDEGFKYFISYQEDEIVQLLCIILPQMSGYIKYFKNSSKYMPFFVRDDNVLDKYNQIWNVIKIH